MLAASAREALAAKLRPVHRALAGWGFVPLPPTQQTIRALGAALKRGGYRQAASYWYLLNLRAHPGTRFSARRAGLTSLRLAHRYRPANGSEGIRHMPKLCAYSVRILKAEACRSAPNLRVHPDSSA